jgi:hypothetical protein
VKKNLQLLKLKKKLLKMKLKKPKISRLKLDLRLNKRQNRKR